MCLISAALGETGKKIRNVLWFKLCMYFTGKILVYYAKITASRNKVFSRASGYEQEYVHIWESVSHMKPF